jgi:hypothetical protein
MRRVIKFVYERTALIAWKLYGRVTYKLDDQATQTFSSSHRSYNTSLHSPVAHNLHSVRAARPTISTISLGRPCKHALVLRPCAELVLRAARDAHATKVAQESPNLSTLVHSLQTGPHSSLEEGVDRFDLPRAIEALPRPFTSSLVSSTS